MTMTGPQALLPRQPVPDLQVPLVGGEPWRLSDSKPQNFTMMVVYRGLHCPICSRYLGELERRLDQFADKGVAAIALSSDPEDRAQQAKTDWKLPNLPIGYDLSLTDARAWGLYLSTGRGKTSAGVDEPAQFPEPGLFLVRPDMTLYFAATQSMPFARPGLQEILGALDFVLKADYPARGEVPLS